MKKTKKYLIKSINFGESSNPARLLVESYEKKHGKSALSKLIRKLIYVFLSEDRDHVQWKSKKLLCEWKEQCETIARAQKSKSILESHLKEQGVDPYETL